MSQIEIPLVARKLQTSGDNVVRAELDLELKTDHGTWMTVRFRVDSGTEMTTMPAAEAEARDLPIPKRPVPGCLFKARKFAPGCSRRESWGWTRPNTSFHVTLWATRTYP